MFDVNHDGEDWFQYLLVLLFHFPRRGDQGSDNFPFQELASTRRPRSRRPRSSKKNQGTRQESYWRRRWLELRRDIFSTVLVEEGIA